MFIKSFLLRRKTMKNRRTVLLAFLLIACLCIGIGYAYVATDLVVKGTATTAVAVIDVEFSDAEVTGASSASGDSAHEGAIVSASTVGAPGDTTISFTAAGLTYDNDEVTATFTITNYNEYAVKIADPTVSALVNFESEIGGWGAGDSNAYDANVLTLEAGASEVFTVTVKLTAPSADKLNETFTVTFKASAGTPLT